MLKVLVVIHNLATVLISLFKRNYKRNMMAKNIMFLLYLRWLDNLAKKNNFLFL